MRGTIVGECYLNTQKFHQTNSKNDITVLCKLLNYLITFLISHMDKHVSYMAPLPYYNLLANVIIYKFF